MKMRWIYAVALALGMAALGTMQLMGQQAGDRPAGSPPALPKSIAATSPATAPAARQSAINPFASFSFGIAERPVAEQVKLLKSLGYDGLTAGMYGSGEGVAQLQAYAKVPQVRNGQFKVYGILWWATAKKPYDSKWLDQVLAEAAKMHAPLWVVVDTAQGDRTGELKATLDLLNAAADQCAKHGVQLVLYPHDGCVFQDTDEALDILQKLNRPEVKISFHVCHELKAGKKDQMAQTFRKAAPHVSLVSVSGAKTDLIFAPGWTDSILPLDEGDLDLAPLAAAMKESSYTGPIVLHTYGITEKPEDHLARSIKWWKALEARVNQQRGESVTTQPATLPAH